MNAFRKRPDLAPSDPHLPGEIPSPVPPASGDRQVLSSPVHALHERIERGLFQSHSPVRHLHTRLALVLMAVCAAFWASAIWTYQPA